MKFEQVPHDERPRERLIAKGCCALSLTELIAIVLRTGTRGKSVLELSSELVGRFGSCEALFDASIAELTSIRGLGKAKAVQLKAAFGIALKYNQTPYSPLANIGSKEAYHLVKEEMISLKQEQMMVILKDVKGRLIAIERVSVGTLSEVLVHPREVFFPAVRHKAHTFILAHNHPSGDPTPSQADIQITTLLLRSSKIMGIILEDHIIVAKEGFVSLRDLGYMT